LNYSQRRKKEKAEVPAQSLGTEFVPTFSRRLLHYLYSPSIREDPFSDARWVNFCLPPVNTYAPAVNLATEEEGRAFYADLYPAALLLAERRVG
jgi:hypothetical protein